MFMKVWVWLFKIMIEMWKVLGFEVDIVWMMIVGGGNEEILR